MITPGFNTSSNISNEKGDLPMFSKLPYGFILCNENDTYDISGTTIPTNIQFSNTDTFFINFWVDYKNTSPPQLLSNPRLRSFDFVTWGGTNSITSLNNSIRMWYFGSNSSGSIFNRVHVRYTDSSGTFNEVFFYIHNILTYLSDTDGFPTGPTNVGVYFDIGTPSNSWACINGVTGTTTGFDNGASNLSAWNNIRLGKFNSNTERDIAIGDFFIGNGNWTKQDAIDIYEQGSLYSNAGTPTSWYVGTGNSQPSNSGEAAFNPASTFIAETFWFSTTDTYSMNVTDVLSKLTVGDRFTFNNDDTIATDYSEDFKYRITSITSGASFYEIGAINESTSAGFSLNNQQDYHFYFSSNLNGGGGTNRKFLMQDTEFSHRKDDFLFYTRMADYGYDGKNFNTSEIYDVISNTKIGVDGALPKIKSNYGGTSNTNL